MLTDLFITLSLSTAPASGAALASPEEFLDSLQAPVAFENVRSVVELSDGIHLEVDYELPGVGRVSIAVHTEDGGWGFGLVIVGETVAAELSFAGGLVAWELVDFSALSPAQAHGVAASLMQVWYEDPISEALAGATLEERDLKCTIAGNIAGAITGIGVFAGCELLVKNPVSCGKAGGGAYGSVAHYITNKCNGAQNH